MCINYQFWNILKIPFASLSQSGVSMIIVESSKDVNTGKITTSIDRKVNGLKNWNY